MPKDKKMWYNRDMNRQMTLAEMNDQFAQYTLGYFFEFGIGIATNYDEAARWYRYSAEQGDKTALSNLKMLIA